MDAFKHSLLKAIDQQISDDHKTATQTWKAAVESWKGADPKTRGARPVFQGESEPRSVVSALLKVAADRCVSLDDLIQVSLSRSVRPAVDVQAKEIRDAILESDMVLLQSLSKEWPLPEPLPEPSDSGAKPPSEPKIDPNPPKRSRSESDVAPIDASVPLSPSQEPNTEPMHDTASKNHETP